MTNTDVLRTEQRGRVLAAFLDRPEVHNALDSRLRQALIDFWGRVRDDDEVSVAIIAGTPGSSFSSGRDMKETQAAYDSGDSGTDWELTAQTGYPVDTPPEKPVIAAVDGYCLGAGLKIAAECDMRICSTDAVFGSPQAKVGRATESPLYLGRIGVPSAVALDMVFTGRRLDAAEALRLGLVSRVVPAGELLPLAWEMGRTVAEGSPLVVRGLKRALDAGLRELPSAIASPMWKRISDMYGDTPDARAGAEAFVNDRTAQYDPASDEADREVR